MRLSFFIKKKQRIFQGNNSDIFDFALCTMLIILFFIFFGLIKLSDWWWWYKLIYGFYTISIKQEDKFFFYYNKPVLRIFIPHQEIISIAFIGHYNYDKYLAKNERNFYFAFMGFFNVYVWCSIIFFFFCNLISEEKLLYFSPDVCWGWISALSLEYEIQTFICLNMKKILEREDVLRR